MAPAGAPDPGGPARRARQVGPREIVNGILSGLRNGCTWHALPHALPPWGTVWSHFRPWRQDVTLERIHAALWSQVRRWAVDKGIRTNMLVII